MVKNGAICILFSLFTSLTPKTGNSNDGPARLEQLCNGSRKHNRCVNMILKHVHMFRKQFHFCLWASFTIVRASRFSLKHLINASTCCLNHLWNMTNNPLVPNIMLLSGACSTWFKSYSHLWILVHFCRIIFSGPLAVTILYDIDWSFQINKGTDKSLNSFLAGRYPGRTALGSTGRYSD